MLIVLLYGLINQVFVGNMTVEDNSFGKNNLIIKMIDFLFEETFLLLFYNREFTFESTNFVSFDQESILIR